MDREYSPGRLPIRLPPAPGCEFYGSETGMPVVQMDDIRRFAEAFEQRAGAVYGRPERAPASGTLDRLID